MPALKNHRTKKSILSIFWPFRVFRAKLPLPKCPWDPLHPWAYIPATALHRKVNLALLLAITELELKKIHQEKNELEKKGGGEGGGTTTVSLTLWP